MTLRRRNSKVEDAVNEHIVSISHSVRSPISPLSSLAETAVIKQPQVVPVMATPDSPDSESSGEDMELNTISKVNVKGTARSKDPEVEEQCLTRPLTEQQAFPRLSEDEEVESFPERITSISTMHPELESERNEDEMEILRSVNTIQIEQDPEDRLLDDSEELNTEGMREEEVDKDFNLDPFQTPD